MESRKPLSTLISPTCKLDKDEKGTNIDQRLYREIIGSLLYLTASRPNILFSMCMCAMFQSNLKESHIIIAKRIIRYLKGTSNLGLWYSKDSSPNLIGYSDVDYGGCKIDKKSISDICQFLGSNLISWHSKKQSSVALSTAEVEYVAVESYCAQMLWIKQQLEDYGMSQNKILIKCDNTSAINILNKHIEIRNHFIRVHIQNKNIILEFVPIEDQLAGIFMKPLNGDRFE